MIPGVRSAASSATRPETFWPWLLVAVLVGAAWGSGVVHVHVEELEHHAQAATGLLHRLGDLLTPLVSVVALFGAVVAGARKLRGAT